MAWLLLLVSVLAAALALLFAGGSGLSISKKDDAGFASSLIISLMCLAISLSLVFAAGMIIGGA